MLLLMTYIHFLCQIKGQYLNKPKTLNYLIIDIRGG